MPTPSPKIANAATSFISQTDYNGNGSKSTDFAAFARQIFDLLTTIRYGVDVAVAVAVALALAVADAVALAVADADALAEADADGEALALGDGDALCGLCFPFSQPRCLPGGVPNGGCPGVPWELGLSLALRPVSIRLALNVWSLPLFSLFSEEAS